MIVGAQLIVIPIENDLVITGLIVKTTRFVIVDASAGVKSICSLLIILYVTYVVGGALSREL